jgi:hypothetical protein
MDFSLSARRLGISAAAGIVLLGLGYAVTLILGLLSLQSPQQPIGGWYFSILELLILPIALSAVVLMVAVHAWAPPGAKAYSLTALVFMGLLSGLTCSVHFVILTVGRQIASADLARSALFLSFKWPSVAYALDIVAWDVFFGLAMLFAAPVFSGGRLATSIRILMITSGVLALAGLSGVVVGDMQLRMIGVIGYAAMFPVVALLLAILFMRTEAVTNSGPRTVRLPREPRSLRRNTRRRRSQRADPA